MCNMSQKSDRIVTRCLVMPMYRGFCGTYWEIIMLSSQRSLYDLYEMPLTEKNIHVILIYGVFYIVIFGYCLLC